MSKSRFLAGYGLTSMLLGVVAAAGVEIPSIPAAPPVGKWDRRSDLAGLQTLLALHGDALTTSERVEYQGQLDRLRRDDGAELDQRRRQKLHDKLRELGAMGMAARSGHSSR